jgi:hypothetical protein
MDHFFICFQYQVEKWDFDLIGSDRYFSDNPRTKGFMKFRLSRHAKKEMGRRAIAMELLESVLKDPQQLIEQPDGKKVYQSQLDFEGGKIFLLRDVVAELADSALVVTVYRTKKIGKYWRTS